jgi:threonine/homoserine/homoserine lactone efflux protein
MHKQAAKNTLMLVLAALMAGIGVSLIVTFIPLQAFLYIAGIAFIGYMGWICYSMEKSRLESLEILNNKD